LSDIITLIGSRKIKPNFPQLEINKYKNFPLIPTYNNFIRVYNTKGNLNMLTESFQRQIILSEFKKWFLQNIHHFYR
jgi:hypothetical protein